MVAAFCGVLIFLFGPETFWDRTPVQKGGGIVEVVERLSGEFRRRSNSAAGTPIRTLSGTVEQPVSVPVPPRPTTRATTSEVSSHDEHTGQSSQEREDEEPQHIEIQDYPPPTLTTTTSNTTTSSVNEHDHDDDDEKSTTSSNTSLAPSTLDLGPPLARSTESPHQHENQDLERALSLRVFPPQPSTTNTNTENTYTRTRRSQPAQTFTQQLKPYNGRLASQHPSQSWLRVALRPFSLYSHPAILWSAAVYSCCMGWLAVMSETVAVVYRNPNTYDFSALSTGLVYISPFIGGLLGTVGAGWVSDVTVRAMARRNGGVYEPEFRLVMILPVALATGAGLMGFGWSATEEGDVWVVPTVFFGLVSFGCSL